MKTAFNRDNEWWLWFCLNAPLSHVGSIAREFEALERKLASREKDLDQKTELINQQDATLKSQNDQLVALSENAASTRSCLIEIDGTILNMMSTPRRAGDSQISHDHEIMEVVDRVRKLARNTSQKGWDHRTEAIRESMPPLEVDPAKVNMEDLVPRLIENPIPVPDGIQGERLHCTKERWEQLIQAEADRDYWQNKCAEREAALKGADDTVKCREADLESLGKVCDKWMECAEERRVVIEKLEADRDNLAGMQKTATKSQDD